MQQYRFIKPYREVKSAGQNLIGSTLITYFNIGDIVTEIPPAPNERYAGIKVRTKGGDYEEIIIPSEYLQRITAGSLVNTKNILIGIVIIAAAYFLYKKFKK